MHDKLEAIRRRANLINSGTCPDLMAALNGAHEDRAWLLREIDNLGEVESEEQQPYRLSSDETQASDSPYTWLRELGAIRPMAVDDQLVLGQWADDAYPIWWKRGRRDCRWDHAAARWVKFTRPDEWYLFGVRCEPMTRRQVVRVLEAIGWRKDQ